MLALKKIVISNRLLDRKPATPPDSCCSSPSCRLLLPIDLAAPSIPLLDYIVRQTTKSAVASRLARRCIVQALYAIGVPEPLSVFVDTYRTGKIPDKDIWALIKENFDFRPRMISINLELMRGGNFRYQKTAAYRHFGRDDPDFTWEKVKLLKPKAFYA